MAHPPGMIAVPRADLARYIAFENSLLHVLRPEGSGYASHVGPSVARNCNEFCRMLLKAPEYAWIWFMGDDHVFQPDLLMKLLDADRDIIVPLVTNKKTPIAPVLYSSYSAPATVKRVQFSDLPREAGIMDVELAGTAGMLVKRHVIEKLGDPWFEFGQMDSELLSEDLWFCAKAREAGFTIACDTRLRMGHTTTVDVWPYQREDGVWGVDFDMGGSVGLHLRIAE